jgi:predicted transcriptional regulator of viral defense system
MTANEKIKDILGKNAGIITTSMCNSEGIHKQNLLNMVKNNEIIRIARGVYALPTAYADDMFLLQIKHKMGVYSMGTALFLHDLTDQTPIKFSMTFPQNYNTKNAIGDNIRSYVQETKFYKLGISTIKTPYGRMVKVYDMEKTICDIVKNKNKVDISMFTNAMKQYSKSKLKQPVNAIKYAETMGIEPEIRKYLEVLI